jgi:predicted nucleic acid-binding protein
MDALVPLLARFPAKRIPLQALLLEAHRLGPAFSAGDSFYVALARRVGGQLRTRDAPLARACAGIVEVALI